MNYARYYASTACQPLKLSSQAAAVPKAYLFAYNNSTGTVNPGQMVTFSNVVSSNITTTNNQDFDLGISGVYEGIYTISVSTDTHYTPPFNSVFGLTRNGVPIPGSTYTILNYETTGDCIFTGISSDEIALTCFGPTGVILNAFAPSPLVGNSVLAAMTGVTVTFSLNVNAGSSIYVFASTVQPGVQTYTIYDSTGQLYATASQIFYADNVIGGLHNITVTCIVGGGAVIVAGAVEIFQCGNPSIDDYAGTNGSYSQTTINASTPNELGILFGCDTANALVYTGGSGVIFNQQIFPEPASAFLMYQYLHEGTNNTLSVSNTPDPYSYSEAVSIFSGANATNVSLLLTRIA